MNSELNYKYMLNLITKLHLFVDEAETAIKTLFANYNHSRAVLAGRQTQELNNLNSQLNAQTTGVKNQTEKMIRDAQGIYDEISELEEELITADKYYLKTKKKTEQELQDRSSDKYADQTDYFAIFEDIKRRYTALADKYKGRKHGILDGLNYAFSSQRKEEYAELIVLKNTLGKLIEEIKEILPTLSESSVAGFKNDFLAKRERLLKQHNANLQYLAEEFNSQIEQTADSICARLDEILPDSFIEELKSAIDEYNAGYGKLDAQRVDFGKYIVLGSISYPYKDMIESSVLMQLVEQKCEKLIVGNELQLPMICSLDGEFNWIVEASDAASPNMKKFTHSIMLGFLSFSPISKLNFCIADVENRGNSVLPFLELKKKVPDMFYGKVLTTQEEIRERINWLNGYIDEFIQNKLGNQYQNIFEYNAANPKNAAPIIVFVAYDFPKGFDELNLVGLKNILRNGNSCGIYSILCHNTKAQGEGFHDNSEQINAIKNLCSVLNCDGDEIRMSGLKISSHAVPPAQEINALASKYMLILEGRKAKDVVFPTGVKRLFEYGDREKSEKRAYLAAHKSLDGYSSKLEAYVEDLANLKKGYNLTFGHCPDDEMAFPKSIMLGSIDYPSEIFPTEVKEFCEKRGLAQNNFLRLPFTCELDAKLNVMLRMNEETTEKMVELSHSFLMSFFSAIPCGKLNVSVFDVGNGGNSILPFSGLIKLTPEILHSQIYTSPEGVQKKLGSLSAYIEDFMTKKLGYEYADFLDYNQHCLGKQEPVELLVIYNFPKGFDARLYELLLEIMKNGSKCGVFTMLCYNSETGTTQFSYQEEYFEKISKLCTTFEYHGETAILSPYNLNLQVNPMIQFAEMRTFVEEYLSRAQRNNNKGLAFADILPKELFSCNAMKRLSIPMGIGAGNSVVNLVMGERGSSHHGLIAGATGSGKSSLLHTIIMSGMLNYSPDQLNLYLMDFKGGTEFKIYESVKLPHIKLLALDAMQEFGESILENLVAEMDERSKLFKAVGQSNLEGYAQNAEKPLPRILVIMDEFQKLFDDSENRRVALHCAELTKRIVTEGRSYGVHLLMATQSTKVIDELTLQRGVIEQMRIRIGLKCGEADARYLFSDKDNKDVQALEMMKGPIGTAVLNDDYTETPNVGFRAAHCAEKDKQNFLKMIAEKYKEDTSAPQIFEGSRTHNMKSIVWSNNLGNYESNITKLWFGEKIKVAPPFVLEVDRRRKHNLLICGAEEEMCEKIVNLCMYSASLNGNATGYCFDGDLIVGDGSSMPAYDVFAAHWNNFHLADDRGGIIKAVREIYEIYKQNRSGSSDTSVFVFIKNLQWLDIVQKMLKDEPVDEEEYIQQEEEPSESPFDWGVSEPTSDENVTTQLRKLVEDGSSRGIYFIFTCTEYTVVKECMYYAENLLAKIPERIIFALNDSDADNLIDGVSVSKLNDNTVYFTDSVKNTFQFKPYIIKDAEDLKECYNRFSF